MTKNLEDKIATKQAKICILGLGYVGLSLMDAFGKKGFHVIGYDRNKHKIEALHQNTSYLSGVFIENIFSLLSSGSCTATHCPDDLSDADVFIICVPTSLDNHYLPDLSKVKSAAHAIKKHLKKNTLVIMQSTSYPGTTEQIILSILQESHLHEGSDFFLSFIPEISDFGNEKFDFAKVPKIVGGITEKSALITKQLYSFITDEVSIVSSSRVAEAAKILQNTYRLINISLINEMKVMFDRMGIDVWEVIDAASKKPFGFTPFYPGPGIGGDCIPVDPMYLVWKAKETGGPTTLIELAAEVNNRAIEFVVNKVIHALSLDKKTCFSAKVLILGVAFKKDVGDIRESPALAIIHEMKANNMNVYYHDPHVPMLIPSQRYPDLKLSSIKWDIATLSDYDCVVILADHSFYNWPDIAAQAKRIVDTRNVIAPFKTHAHKVVKA
jgi:UDP-N-acetyl-D-glucosamine dehydrogenase